MSKLKFTAKKTKKYPKITFNKDNKSGNDKSAVKPLKNKKADVGRIPWVYDFDLEPAVDPDDAASRVIKIIIKDDMGQSHSFLIDPTIGSDFGEALARFSEADYEQDDLEEGPEDPMIGDAQDLSNGPFEP
jgi:hypothetical protein